MREVLAAEGALRGRALRIERLVSLGMTRAEKADARNYREGDTVLFNQDMVNFRVKRDEALTVTGTEEDRVLLLHPDGRPRRIAPQEGYYRYRLEVYETREIEIRAGDRIRWTRNDKRRELVNGGRAEVAAITKDRVRFALDDGRNLSLRHGDPQLRHLDHAWSTTVHGAQGSTADGVIAVLDSGHGSLTDQSTFYVEISRARRQRGGADRQPGTACGGAGGAYRRAGDGAGGGGRGDRLRKPCAGALRRRSRFGRRARSGPVWKRRRGRRARSRSWSKAMTGWSNARRNWRIGRTCRARSGRSWTAFSPTTGPAARATGWRMSSWACWTRMRSGAGRWRTGRRQRAPAAAGREAWADWRAMAERLAKNGRLVLEALGPRAGEAGARIAACLDRFDALLLLGDTVPLFEALHREVEERARSANTIPFYADGP